MPEKMQLGLYVNDSCVQEVIAVMVACLSFVFATIEYSVRWLMCNENICVIGDVLDVLLVSAVHGIFHEHRHAIELYAVNINTGVAEVVYIVRQSFHLVCSIHAHDMIACDKYLMLIRQVAEPLHEFNSLFL